MPLVLAGYYLAMPKNGDREQPHVKANAMFALALADPL
jgi:hypothetical protein